MTDIKSIFLYLLDLICRSRYSDHSGSNHGSSTSLNRLNTASTQQLVSAYAISETLPANQPPPIPPALPPRNLPHRTTSSATLATGVSTTPQNLTPQVGRGISQQSYHSQHLVNSTANFSPHMVQPGSQLQINSNSLNSNASSNANAGSLSFGGAIKCFPNQQPIQAGERSDYTDNDEQMSSGSTPNAGRKSSGSTKRKSNLFSVS